jgi:hypothetical protein
MARPLVGHGELRLDRRILLAEFRETRPHPFQRRLRRQSFSGRSSAGEKRLDLPQLLAQLRFGRHRLASSCSLHSKALHSAKPTSIRSTPLSTSFRRRKHNYRARVMTLTLVRARCPRKRTQRTAVSRWRPTIRRQPADPAPRAWKWLHRAARVRLDHPVANFPKRVALRCGDCGCAAATSFRSYSQGFPLMTSDGGLGRPLPRSRMRRRRRLTQGFCELTLEKLEEFFLCRPSTHKFRT